MKLNINRTERMEKMSKINSTGEGYFSQPIITIITNITRSRKYTPCVNAVLCRVNPARQNSAERRFAKIRKILSGMVSGGNVYPTHSPRIPDLPRRNTSCPISRFCMLRKKRPQSAYKASANRRFMDTLLWLRCRFVVASLTLSLFTI